MSDKRKSGKNVGSNKLPITNGPMTMISVNESTGAIKKKQNVKTKPVNKMKTENVNAEAMAICEELVQKLVLNGTNDEHQCDQKLSANSSNVLKQQQQPQLQQPIIFNNNNDNIHNKNNENDRFFKNGDHNDHMCNNYDLFENSLTISSTNMDCANGIVLTNSSLREAQKSMRNDSYSSDTSNSSEFTFDTRQPATVSTIQSDECIIDIKEYVNELQMPDLIRVIQKDLSEPYSIYTYRYFIHNWPKLCFLAMDGEKCIGAIVCKLDAHRQTIRRGYIAMLAVDKDYRKLKIGTTLVQKAIEVKIPIQKKVL